MGLFSRSERKFQQREPRVVPRYASGTGPAPFVYYPAGSSAGFRLGSFADESRVGQAFAAEYGWLPSEAAVVPGWTPAMTRRR